MPATSYKIRGIAPPDLAAQPDPIRKQFWRWVVDVGLKVKDGELAKGLDKDGEPLRPIAAATRRHRRSAMTPDGKGDPNAPPLMPAYQLSRTRSLLAGRALPTHAEFFWRFDPFTGDSWGKVLAIHAAKGRDVIGLSPGGVAKVKAQAWQRWEHYKRGTPKLTPAIAQPADAAAPAEIVSAAPLRGWDWRQWQQHFREPNPTPVVIPGRPAGHYNRILAHTWGTTPATGGPKAPGRPKAPKPKPTRPIPATHAPVPATPPRPIPATHAPVPATPAAKPAPPSYAFDALGNLSPGDIAEIRAAIEALPRAVLDALDRHGERWVFAEKFADWNAAMAAMTPRGWPQGNTWAQADGAHSIPEKVILACKTYLSDDGKFQHESYRRLGVLRHETGHGFDQAIGHPSKLHPDWEAAYNRDLAALDPADRPALAYYLQGRHAGREEAFAELFAQLNGGGATGMDLRARFPECAKLMTTWIARGSV